MSLQWFLIGFVFAFIPFSIMELTGGFYHEYGSWSDKHPILGTILISVLWACLVGMIGSKS